MAVSSALEPFSAVIGGFAVKIVDGGARMISEGELCRNGGSWQGHLALTYSRVTP